jgi:hypothetical protein
VIGTIAGLGVASPAVAQNRPYVSAAPTTSGSAVVGSTLTSTGGQAGGPRGTTVGRAWLRCTNPGDERTCQLIDGAWNTSSYRVTSADLGKRIRSALYAYRDYPRDLVWRMSAATAAVTNPAPPKPAPAPTPVPTPVPTPAPPAAEPPAPVVQPVAQPLPTVQVQAPVLKAPQARAKRMRPFPVVRISGVLTTNGAQISRLTVKAPKRARIRISCTGKGCPQRRVTRAAKGRSIHVPSLETYLRAGIKLTITVSRTGYISKVTTIRIRKAKAPLRSDLCREPGSTKRVRCRR